MSWFYIALLAPLLYAIVNLIDDNLLQYVFEGPYVATAISSIFGALPVASLLFLHADHISVGMGGLALLAGFLSAFYVFFYFKALQVEQPSVVITLFNLTPATLPFLAHFLLHERLNGMVIVGFIIVLAASFAIAATDIKKFKFSAALLPVVIAVVLIDIVSLLTKHVYQNVQFYPAYMYFSAGIGLGGLYFMFIVLFTKARNGLSRFKVSVRKVIPIFILAEATYLSAEFTINLAVSRGSVSLVEVIRSIQPMFVLLIALVLYPFAPKFFREATGGQLVKKFTFMLMAVFGLVLINVAIKS